MNTFAYAEILFTLHAHRPDELANKALMLRYGLVFLTEMPFADVSGARLYYELNGAGPAVVLLHGWTLDTTMLDDQFDEFSKHYQVLRYDMRGYGKSDLSEEVPYAHHEDLKALFDHLRIDRAALIGLSMGGATAINFTLTYPERISALVTVDSWMENCTSLYMREFNRSLSEIFTKGKKEGIGSARSYWMGMPLFKPAIENPRCSAKLKDIVRRYSGWDFVNNARIIRMDPIPERRLHEVKVPTLVIVGELDDPGFLDVASMISSGVRDSEKVTMKGVGHMSNMENPEEFNRIVSRFLAKTL